MNEQPNENALLTLFHLLGKMEGKLDEALKQGTSHSQELKALASRVSALERWRAYLAGIAVACSTAAALLAKHF